MKERFQCLQKLVDLLSLRTSKFGCARTSFPKDAADSHFRVMPSRIGSRRGGSFYPNSALIEPRPGIEAMQRVLVDLTQALRERLAIIHDEDSRRDEAQHIARLRAISEKIDKLQEALPQAIDPRLTHYLERKSYDKALEYLEDRDD
jgi:hypothetical protein